LPVADQHDGTRTSALSRAADSQARAGRKELTGLRGLPPAELAEATTALGDSACIVTNLLDAVAAAPAMVGRSSTAPDLPAVSRLTRGEEGRAAG